MSIQASRVGLGGPQDAVDDADTDEVAALAAEGVVARGLDRIGLDVQARDVRGEDGRVEGEASGRRLHAGAKVTALEIHLEPDKRDIVSEDVDQVIAAGDFLDLICFRRKDDR